MLPAFAYARPRTLREALDLLKDGQGAPLAGGTDLQSCLRDGVSRAERLVSLGFVAELHGLELRPDGSLRLGALTPLAELARHPAVRERFPVLSRAALSVGSPQLRNQGTVGGNLLQRPRCWYFRGDFPCARKGGEVCFAQDGQNARHAILGAGRCIMVHPSDTAPALIALDAVARIVGPKGTRQVPVGELFVGPERDVRRETVLAPGELLVEVTVPAPAPGTRSVYDKARARGSFDFALVGAAVVLRLEGTTVGRARVVLSGVAPIPWRSREAEAALEGKALDAASIHAAADAALAKAQPFAENGYKVPMAKGLLQRALGTLAAAS
jgi:xanthine dehydrogenase YagS FAD-binding subunit